MFRQSVLVCVVAAISTIASPGIPAEAVNLCPAPGTLVTSSGADYCVFTYTTVGTSTWTTPTGVTAVEYLIVGGGGGGGSNKGGGGGGGAVSSGTKSGLVDGGSWSIIVGLGGTGGPTVTNNGGTGGASSAFGITSAGGGGGSAGSLSGGSSGSGASGGLGSSPSAFAGGGGGGRVAGGNRSGTTGGAGGAGTASSISGTPATYGGGGGGGATGVGGTGGAGGGANGSTAAGESASANLGGGGGGGGNGLAGGSGGAGGSGIVVVRYLLGDDPAHASDAAQAPARFTISFDANGGTCTPESSTEDDGTWLQLPTAGSCTRAGFELVGWNTMVDSTGLGFTPGGWTQVTGDNILHAIWSVPEVVLTDPPEVPATEPLAPPATPVGAEFCAVNQSVLFDYRSTKLSPAARTRFTVLAQGVPAQASVVVTGIVRATGATTADRARALSRAQAVADQLRHSGFTGAIAVLNDGRTRDHSARARRVDITTRC